MLLKNKTSFLPLNLSLWVDWSYPRVRREGPGQVGLSRGWPSWLPVRLVHLNDCNRLLFRDALCVIENVDQKPPWNLRVEMALTQQEKARRNEERQRLLSPISPKVKKGKGSFVDEHLVKNLTESEANN